MTPHIPPLLSLEDFRTQLNAQLEQLLQARRRAAEKLDPLYGELINDLSQFMARGGKRLRPYLTYLAYRGFGGASTNQDIIEASVSQELYHNAWLIHDDIIDRDIKRYGGPNITGVYQAKFTQRDLPNTRHLADAVALMAGDINLTLATDVLAKANFATELKLAAIVRAQQAGFEVLGGELLDTLIPTLEDAQLSVERLLRVYRYKTASYSFESPLHIGGLLADATSAQLASLEAFAHPLGVAFQLTDDLLGTYGSESELGKPVLSDLREGKRTVLYLLGLELATGSARERLVHLLGNPKVGYRHLEEVRQLLGACGARAQAQDLAHHYLDRARRALQRINFTPEVASILAQLAGYIERRRA